MTDQPNGPTGDQPETPGPTEPAGEAVPTKDERTMAMLAHLLGIILCIIGPLIIWVIKKDESKFIDDQGKEAMNFQIIPLILYVAGTLLWCLILPPLAAVVMWVIVVILSIMAALKANEGVRYRYPFALRLIK